MSAREEIRAEAFREAAAAIVAENDRMLWASRPGRHWAADLVLRMAETAAGVAELGALPVPVGSALSEVERLRARVAELEAQREADRKTWQHDLRTARDEREATAARVAELEALKPAPIQECRVCGAGYTYGEPCQTCAFRERMAAELKVRGWEDPHDSPLHRAHKVPHDLEWPETGDQR